MQLPGNMTLSKLPAANGVKEDETVAERNIGSDIGHGERATD